MAKESRDVTRPASRKQFAAKLRRLADAVETGAAFRIQVGGEQIRVPADAEVSVEHERGKDGAEELELQVRWKRV